MSKVTAKIKEEFLELIPPTLFFFVALMLIALIRSLMLKGTGIALSTPAQVAISALILGKAVLLADMLPMINRFPDKPLIYNVSWKTAIYVVMAMAIHYLERLYDYWKEAGGFIAGNEKLLADMNWSHFWAIQLLLTVLILNYVIAHEMALLVGPKKVRAMFFGPMPAKDTGTA